MFIVTNTAAVHKMIKFSATTSCNYKRPLVTTPAIYPVLEFVAVGPTNNDQAT